MNNIVKSEFTVLGSRYHKSNDGKITIYLQVQKNQTTPVGYVKYVGIEPPLPGTIVQAKGSVVETNQGPVMNVISENDITIKSGQQSYILYETVKNLLNRFKISFDDNLLKTNCYDVNTHLCQLNKNRLISILDKSNVIDAKLLIDEREEAFSMYLTKNYFNSLETIKHPYDIDTKKELPFIKNSWPDDILKPCVNSPIESAHGKQAHSAMPSNKPMYIGKWVKFDGIDNFFRSLSIYMKDHNVFHSWMRDVLRPSTITQTYIEEKQKKGTQIFTSDDLKQLERLGLNAPAKIAARVGNMIQLPSENGSKRLIPLGTYQSSTLISQLGKLSREKNPLNVSQIDDNGLDSFQKKALHSFIEGSPITLVSGPPGTGKSTLISRMIQHAKQANKDVVVVTPTGKSSARLNESFEKIFGNKVVSGTIHSLFYSSSATRKINKGAPAINVKPLRDALDSTASDIFPIPVDRIMRSTSYVYNKNNVAKPEHQIYSDICPPEILRGSIVFIDESTQVTSDLMALIMEMNPARIIMTGDPSQLKPVGAGKPFHDLIDLSKKDVYNDVINFAELEIDHRATKELSDFTKKLRQGSIPIEYVDTYQGNANDVANNIVNKEASVIECTDTNNINEIVESIYKKTITKQNAFFDIVDPNDTQASINSIKLPLKTSKNLSVQKLVSPSIMSMAYTNAEVSSLNHSIASIIRPLMSTGDKIVEIPSLSAFTMADIQLGDAILQTENSKTRLLYTTPQGHNISSSSMNGETFIFAAANLWLPIPKNNTEADNTILDKWRNLGLESDMLSLKNDVMKITDPEEHFKLFKKLQNLASSNKDALELIQWSLTEILLIDQHKIKTGPQIELSNNDIKRIVIPPALPNDLKNNISINYESLIRHIWNIDVANIGSKPGHTGIIELTDYKIQYEKLMDGIQSLSLGNAYTVHKAQGSQAQIAISIVSSPNNPDDASSHEASVYTAVTRAEKNSCMLINNITAEKLNTIWSNARLIEKDKLSPIQLIATGQLPPAQTSGTIITSIPPQRLGEQLNNTDNMMAADAKMFRKKMQFSTYGLPSTLNTDYLPIIEQQISNTSGEHKYGREHTKSLVPNLKGLVSMKIEENSIKQNYEWIEQSKDLVSKSIENDLGDLLSDFSF